MPREKLIEPDITQSTAEYARLAEQKFQNIIAEVEDYAILVLDPEGIIRSWNKGANRIKGYTAEEIIGRSFRVFYTTEDQKSGVPDALLAQATETGRIQHEGWRVRKDGSKFWGSVTITAIHDTANTVTGYLKVTRDLTERKKSEDLLRESSQELARKNAELEKLNEELSSFAYVVSHDLKEPIRKIQVFANRQLEPGKTAEQLKEFSAKIVSSASRMQ